MPDYLYHYTNLETLKLILQNKTFRLSSLNRMDDLEEGDTEDFNKLGRFIYISSWTSNPNESLLLWNYSKDNEGVRLRMKSNIFKTVQVNCMPISFESAYHRALNSAGKSRDYNLVFDNCHQFTSGCIFVFKV